MEKKEMIEDMLTLGMFNDEELEEANDIEAGFDIFKSIEYHAIYYLTNEALHYLPDELFSSLEEGCDTQEDTDLATIFCFK